uniref:Uncharacterized protein n=1 Tax=Rhizophagus irregularis (strain DAOM 181602 / DAOM 197198 / MUCL 43194) TaxID=747089 RepID=U9UIX1_RHIID
MNDQIRYIKFNSWTSKYNGNSMKKLTETYFDMISKKLKSYRDQDQLKNRKFDILEEYIIDSEYEDSDETEDDTEDEENVAQRVFTIIFIASKPLNLSPNMYTAYYKSLFE